MSIAQKLGADYESIRAAAKFKSIQVKLNDIEFSLKVRVPVKREMEFLTSTITDPDQKRVDAIYEALASPLKKTIESADSGFLEALNADKEKIKVTDNDLIVDGTSVRHIAQMSAVWQLQVERYFSLLQSATGEPICESFDEISEEFPENIIREIVMQIDEAIRPNYKAAKKN